MTTFSPFQTAVIGAVKAGSEHIVVDAKAGSGKSFTILASIQALRASGDLDGGTLLMAFNKSIQVELTDKCRSKGIPTGGYKGLTVKTFHSLGFAAWMRFMGKRVKVKVDDRKSWNILRNAVKNPSIDWIDKEFVSEYGTVAAKLTAYAKNEGVGAVIDGVRSYQRRSSWLFGCSVRARV